MNTEYLFDNPNERDPLAVTFRDFANLAYKIATMPDLPTSPLDDAEAIPTFRRKLREACLEAKKDIDATPNDAAKKFEHAFLIESELVELLAAAPASATASNTYLTFRMYLFDFAQHLRRIYGSPTSYDTRN